MAAIDLTDETFTESLASGLCVVDFHAGWCGPCIMFKPKFKRISKDYEGKVNFFLVNGESCPEARKTVEISDLPFFAFYKDGKMVGSVSTTKEDAFRAFVDEHAS